MNIVVVYSCILLGLLLIALSMSLFFASLCPLSCDSLFEATELECTHFRSVGLAALRNEDDIALLGCHISSYYLVLCPYPLVLPIRYAKHLLA